MRIIGIDPGLQHTGWGIIDVDGNHLKHVANGAVHSTAKKPMAERLLEIFDGLSAIVGLWAPVEAAVEETFVNQNPVSTLKLGTARGIALLVPAKMGLTVAEYPANLIKKSVVGAGHADKNQVQRMVTCLLPGVDFKTADAADALAIAICHAHHAASARKYKEAT